MDNYTSQISLSALNSNFNGEMTTIHDGLVTIKHEPQDIEEEIFPFTTLELPTFMSQEYLMSNEELIHDYTKRFQLKECSIRLEKCDKIWETLKFIKNLQTPGPSRINKNSKIAVKSVQNESPCPSPMVYEPVLNNGNLDFHLSIKSWKRLYTCTICSKQYVDKRSLKAHISKIHNKNPKSNSSSRNPSPIESQQFQEFAGSSAKLSDSKLNQLKPFECSTCGVRYADTRSLAGHSLRLHGIITDFHEKWLKQQDNPSDYTVEHLLKRHSCNSCGKRYSCTKSLRLHYYREHDFVLPPLRSGRRGKPSTSTFTHTGDMSKHMNVCTICGKKYTKNWYLRAHSLQVHGIPMICNKTKKNSTPAVRVIKKEVSDELVGNNHLPTEMNFPAPQVKEEPKEPVVIPPTQNVRKRNQCSACNREFISISKLRVHCQALHGIVIPYIRKPYRKANATITNKSGKTIVKNGPRKQVQSVNTEGQMIASMEMNMTNEPKLQVSTPKQVSLDRYFKPPVNADVFQKVTTTSQSVTKGDDTPPKDLQLEKKAPKTPAKESPEAKSETQTKASVDLISCPLCKSQCKNLRKHFVDYHKIICPETNVMKDLASVSNDSTITSPEPEKQTSEPIKKQPTRKRRRKCITMGKKKKRKIANTPKIVPLLQEVTPMVVDTPTDENIIQNPVNVTKSNENQSPPKKESPKLIGPTKTQHKCNICGGFYANPKSLKIHRERHRMKGETKDNIHLISHNYKNMWKPSNSSQKLTESFNEELELNIGNDSRTSSNESITRSSSSLSDSMKSSTQRTYSVSETTCECGRGFRDPHTMYLHKDKCQTVNKMEREKIMVARSSSDRDSGIGISITIKKKNDSYEIVSRDSGDDDKSKDSSISKDYDHMSHSSDSNYSNGVFNDRKFLDLIKGQCSKNHSVLKIEDADDDVDVDIEDDSQIESMNTIVLKKELKSPTATAEEDDKFNRTIDPLDVDLYRCAICLELFKDMESHTEHMEIHESTTVNESSRFIRQGCPCGKTFRGAQSFLTHVEEFHPFWLQCGYCEVTFLSSKEYYSHSCEVSKIGKMFEDFQEIICHYCSSKVRMMNFESHVTAHHFTPDKPLLCYFCKMRFTTKRHRTIHMNDEHAKPNCRICGQILRYDFVAKHEAYHDGLGYPCHKCKKAFTSLKLLKHHEFDVHTKDETKCSICFKIVSKRYLKSHMQLHTIKEKCKLCIKGFPDVELLQDHIELVHQNIYPFLKCDTCKETFISEEQLKTHFAQDSCKKIIKKISKKKEIEQPEESKQKKSLNGIANTKPSISDGNHSEMEESVEMNEPLVLDPSSDIDRPLEVAESTINDINEQIDSSKVISPVEVKGSSLQQKIDEQKETETEEKIKVAENLDTTKQLNKTETVKMVTIADTEITLQIKIPEGTENSESKKTLVPSSTTETKLSESEETVKYWELRKPFREITGSSETELMDSDFDDNIHLVDSCCSEDPDMSLIDVTGVSCNSTAKSEQEIVSSMEVDETPETVNSASIENSKEMEVNI